MNAIRIGRDINVKWCVTMGNKAVDLDKLDLSIILQAPNNYRREMPFKVIEDPETGIKNIIRFNFLGVDQKVTGEYIITLYLNKNKVGQNILDKHFIRLVPRTWSENCNCSESLQTEQIQLDGDMTGDYIGHAELESILSSYIKAEDIDEDGNINFNVDLSNYYTKAQVDNKFATKTSVVTKAEAETLISQKVDAKLENVQLTNYVTKDELEAKDYITEHQDISGKADLNQVYTKTEADNKFLLKEDVPEAADLSNYVTKDELTGKGYLTEHQDISGKADANSVYTKTEIDSKGFLTEHQSLVNYYTKTETDSKFLLKKDVPEAADLSNYVTKDELNGKGFLTEHQDISGKADVTSVYTKGEIDSKGFLTEHQDITGKADLSEVYTKGEIDSKGFLTEHQDISGKADANSVYTKTEIDNKNLASKTDLNSYLLLSGGTLTNRLTVGDKDNAAITNAFTHLRKVNDSFVGMAFSVGGDSTASIQHKIYTTDFGSARNDAVLRFDSTNGLEFGTAASGSVSTYKKVLLDGDAYTKTETDSKFDKLVWEGTQEQYDALSSTDKAAYKIYAIIEG